MERFFVGVVVFSIAVSFLSGLLVFQETRADVVIVTVTISVCGNHIAEGDEECDGPDLRGKTCQDLDFDGGVLACGIACTFDTGGCWMVPPVPPVVPPPPPPPVIITRAIIEGKAHPESLVTILKDGRVAAIVTADPLARFRVEIIDITPGIWTFGIWGLDGAGRRSLTFSFTTHIAADRVTTITGIFLPPTIEIDRDFLQRGEILNIMGMTAPESEVTIFVDSPERIVLETRTGVDGIWFYPFNTAPLLVGVHGARAKAVCPDGLLSVFSQTLAFGIGEVVPVVVCPRADFNRDGRTDLIDFSIMMYWWERFDPCVDQNLDGIVNFIDFSIMMFYWTG